jgi:RimJ/RimL family protein N-acetyltransferase
VADPLPATVVLFSGCPGDGPDARSPNWVTYAWPPDYLDEPSLEYTLERLAEGPENEGWWLHFVVLKNGGGSGTLIGSGGYKGPPSAEGTVEIGYSIVESYQRRGLGARRPPDSCATRSRIPP